jgi:hypothetical protein
MRRWQSSQDWQSSQGLANQSASGATFSSDFFTILLPPGLAADNRLSPAGRDSPGKKIIFASCILLCAFFVPLL